MTEARVSRWIGGIRVPMSACGYGLVLLLLITMTVGCAATDAQRSTGERIDDATLLTRVKTALISSDETDGMDIDVEVFRGRVQLNGIAESESARAAATRVAEDVTGVVAVDNNLQISAAARQVGEYVDDKSLEARVKTALTRAEDVSGLAIEVEAYRGEVSLGGFVESERERQRASEVAQTVSGVRAVHNNVAVRPPPAS